MSAPVFNFRLHSKNSLKGFFDVLLPSGMVLHGLTLHEQNGKSWCGMPAKPIAKDSGEAWVRIVDFVDPATNARFQAQVVPHAVEAFKIATEKAEQERIEKEKPVIKSQDRTADIVDDF